MNTDLCHMFKNEKACERNPDDVDMIIKKKSASSFRVQQFYFPLVDKQTHKRVYKYVSVNMNKCSDYGRGQPKGSLFKSYYTEV